MSGQAIASIKSANGTEDYCLKILSSVSLSDKEKLSLVIGDSLITFNKHIVCSLSPWISGMLKDEYSCVKEHVFISLPEQTSLTAVQSLKEVIETGTTHDLDEFDKEEVCEAIRLLGIDIQLNTIVRGNIDNVANVDCHEEVEDPVNDEQEQEPVISTEDMFTDNVEMDSQETMAVEDEGEDTNNNERSDSWIEEDLEPFNVVKSTEDDQSKSRSKFKECEVKINRLSMKSFVMMRNCSVKLKKLDGKFDIIAQDLQMETPNNWKQRSSIQTSAGVDTLSSQASSSAVPFDQDITENGSTMSPLKEKDASEDMKISKATERSKIVVTTRADGNIAPQCDISTVILYSAHCDEFFSSLGHTPSSADDQEASSHEYARNTVEAKEKENNGKDGEEDMADRIKKNRRSASKMSNPPQFDGHISEMGDINTEEEGDVNTEEEGVAFVDENSTIITNKAKPVSKVSSYDRSCISDERYPENERSPTAEKEKHKRKAFSKMSSSGRVCLRLEKVHKEVLHANRYDSVPDIMESENHERDLFEMIEERSQTFSSPEENGILVEEDTFIDVNNGEMEKCLKNNENANLDAEVPPLPTTSREECSKSPKNKECTTDDEEEIEKQIELVPKIRIKRNLIQWAFEFDPESTSTPTRRTSKRKIESSDDENEENQVEDSPRKKSKRKIESSDDESEENQEEDRPRKKSKSKIESSDDENEEDQEEDSHMKKSRTKPKQWRPYSKEEDKNIVLYMKKNVMRGRQGGRKIWQLMEEENVCPGRTWQSMKERWIKRIEPNLGEDE